MKYVELFAGIGGFRVGIQKAIPDAECVYASEWNKYAVTTNVICAIMERMAQVL